MTPELAATWGTSIIAETTLLVRLCRSLSTPSKSYPWFLVFVWADVALNIVLMALSLKLPSVYYPVWLISEIILLIVQVAMSVEAIRKMHLAHRLPPELIFMAVGLSVALSIVVYVTLTGPLRWPDAALEYTSLVKGTLFSCLSILLMSLPLCPQRWHVLGTPASKHSIFLSVYLGVNGAAYFAVGKAYFNVALTLSTAACYVCWSVMFRKAR